MHTDIHIQIYKHTCLHKVIINFFVLNVVRKFPTTHHIPVDDCAYSLSYVVLVCFCCVFFLIVVAHNLAVGDAGQ